VDDLRLTPPWAPTLAEKFSGMATAVWLRI